MAEAAKAVATLLSNFADNSTGNISAEELRDFVVTALGVYGSITVNDASAEQVDIGTTDVKLTCFTADGNSNAMTPSHTNDQITILVAGDYDVTFTCSFLASAGVWQMHLAIDDVLQPYGFHRKIGIPGDVGSASFIAPGITLAVNEVLSVYVVSEGATDDITVVDAALSVRLVG